MAVEIKELIISTEVTGGTETNHPQQPPALQNEEIQAKIIETCIKKILEILERKNVR